MSDLRDDLERILDQSAQVWPTLRGVRLFLTGGTGFMGCWLLESLLLANRRLGLGAEVTVLTRSPEAFRRKAPHVADAPGIRLVAGDVVRLPSVPGSFDYVIHAATDASASLLHADPLQMFDTAVLGTRNVLDWAKGASVKRVLFTSSGAVYGKQPHDLETIPEDWQGALNCASASSAYAEGKRAAETLCAIYTQQHGLPISIARCFAFVGPYLPLDAHFAIGNFIRDAIQGNPIVINGDGTPYRSYLYATDLCAWLWHLLVAGVPGVVNVGSDQAITIADLAALVVQTLGGGDVQVMGRPLPGARAERYVPDIRRAMSLGLRQTVSLEEGILRTAAWHGFGR